MRIICSTYSAACYWVWETGRSSGIDFVTVSAVVGIRRRGNLTGVWTRSYYHKLLGPVRSVGDLLTRHQEWNPSQGFSLVACRQGPAVRLLRDLEEYGGRPVHSYAELQQRAPDIFDKTYERHQVARSRGLVIEEMCDALLEFPCITRASREGQY